MESTIKPPYSVSGEGDVKSCSDLQRANSTVAGAMASWTEKEERAVRWK